jgi:solute carrier family 25 thiamine pyrophosphate transporter 19
MSPASQPLRDEVGHPRNVVKLVLIIKTQGTRSQVIIAGAVSGLVSRFCIAPLDVVKIRLQLQYHSLADPLSQVRPSQTPAGVYRVARDILQHEGISGFWKGNIPAEGLYLSYGAVQFWSYRTLSQALEKLSEESHIKIPGAAKSFVSGAVAGTAATTATYPLDLLRTRFAAQGTEKVYDGLVASIRDIARHEGSAGFFRGLTAAIGQIIPYMGLFFATYETLKPLCSEIELPFGSGDALAGITASVMSKTAVFPFDTVRKRLQVQGPTRRRYISGERIPVYSRGVLGTLMMILHKEGSAGLYRGLTVGLLKAAPASAVTMWTYEQALHMLERVEERRNQL